MIRKEAYKWRPKKRSYKKKPHSAMGGAVEAVNSLDRTVIHEISEIEGLKLEIDTLGDIINGLEDTVRSLKRELEMCKKAGVALAVVWALGNLKEKAEENEQTQPL